MTMRANPQPRTQARSQAKILIVEDNPLLQRAMKDMLGLWGVGLIATAANGQEAKEALRRESFDLMVTDWVMQPVGGAQLIEWVRRSPGCLRPDLPIVVLTANADLSTVRAAWDAGADTVLAKPVPAATLARRIEAVLNRHDGRPDGRPGTSRPADAAPHPTTPPASPPQASSAAEGADAHRQLPRLPAPAGETPTDRMRTADPKRLRLLLALDRLEAAIERPDAIGSRLRHAVADLQAATADDHAASPIAASLSTCVTWVEPDTDGFADALQAHAAALRWAAGRDGSAQSMAVALCLIRTLRATVRTLALRGQSDVGSWPDQGAAPGDADPPTTTRPT